MKETSAGSPEPLEGDPVAPPAPHELDGGVERVDNVAGQAADAVADALQVADDTGQRDAAIRVLNDELGESGLRVVDVARPASERRGVHTGLTREELLAELATQRHIREIREARTAQIMGRRVVKNATGRRRG